jgi:hypothetical protein
MVRRQRGAGVTEIAAHSGPGSVARWDQLHAEALATLTKADGFILLTFESVDGGSPGEIRACSKVGGPEVVAAMLGQAHSVSEAMLHDLADWLEVDEAEDAA